MAAYEECRAQDDPPRAARLPGEPWAEPADAAVAAWNVRPERGLDAHAVREARHRYGPNRLREPKRRSAWRILAAQFASVLVILLVVAAGVAFVFVDRIDGIAIFAVIAINVAIGFFTELRAARSMEALYRLGQVQARVRRGGRLREIPAGEIVPGDIVVVEGGDVVTADARLVTASRLQVEEAALTGESVPVEKSAAPVAREAPLAERTNMLYKGTAVTRGSGEGVVVATGLGTELGKITSLTEQTGESQTPLEHRLELLGRRLVWATLVVTGAVLVAGLAAGRNLFLMIETAIALAVATVPEGLPIVATLALARGMWRMARRNALVNRLSAVETLGATAVICTDKTGTLTENQMAVASVEVDADPARREALEIGALCNNAQLGDKPVGDPMEVALLAAAERAGISRSELLEAQPEVREESFETETKMMATFHRGPDGFRVAVKGAPEPVVAACTRVRGPGGTQALDETGRRNWLERNEALAADGLRVLAVATKDVSAVADPPYRDLALVGLVGFRDPPRPDVREAIEHCREAGIRVVMVTGDQAVTAQHVAAAVGLAEVEQGDVIPGVALDDLSRLSDAERERLREADVIARVDPKQKLNLVELHQSAGAIVAMTGDGVNDAPALKKADIGIAMGQRGTQVAREASDIVLKDDAFPTIAAAVEQGRIIFDNLRKFVVYLLSCNLSEVLIVALATVVSAPLPILPLQILFLNLVTDVFPALALGLGAGGPGVMQRRPRPSGEPILTRSHWLEIIAYGALITLSVLGAFWIALAVLGLDARGSVTVSFLTLACAQLWHVFDMRDPSSTVLRSDVVRNPYVWGALALCAGLLAIALYVPAGARLLSLTPLDASAWAVIALFSLLPVVVGQLWLSVRARFRTARRREVPRRETGARVPSHHAA